MNHSIRSVAWLGLGLIAVVTTIELARTASGQAVSVIAPTISTWPPAAADMISFTGIFKHTTNGQTQDVYTVPPQRWLVLTEIRGQYAQTSGLPLPCGVELIELNGAAPIVRLEPAFMAKSNLAATAPVEQHTWMPGLSFGPGSKLQLRVNAPFCVTGSGEVVGEYSFALAGYLSR